jgi:basic amino acid/polyamine antiporter, APA family
MTDKKAKLKRNLSLTLITFYGLGNILGAGIYVLVGKVAGEAGYFAPLSFFVASIIAGISAFSYAELSARYPVSAGESVYVYEGFGRQRLSLTVGLLVGLAGIVSAATIAHGFVGYMQVFTDLPGWLMMTLLILALGGLAAWGISQSVRVAAFLTLAEVAGLLIIIFVGADQVQNIGQLYELEQHGQQAVHHGFSVIGVFSGAFLAFYAYIGFEDMVNVAEEVKDPQRTMPRAILLCVIISMLLYGMVSLVSISVLTPEQLSKADAPLAAVYYQATGRDPVVISFIGIFAVINGALIQIIMASRIFYGMADRGWLPAILSDISPTTHTPIKSTILTVLLLMLFALLLPMVALAEFTSSLVLLIFALVNLSLIRIKRRQPRPDNVRVYPIWLPQIGFVTSLSFLSVELVAGFL